MLKVETLTIMQNVRDGTQVCYYDKHGNCKIKADDDFVDTRIDNFWWENDNETLMFTFSLCGDDRKIRKENKNGIRSYYHTETGSLLFSHAEGHTRR